MEMEIQQKPLTVSEVTRAVKLCVESSFPQVWIRGELCDLTVHSSGHVYFGLKDGTSQISGAAFRFAQKAVELGLERGMEVDVRGRLTVYEPRGTYQIQASSIMPVGAGELNRRFEELKARLGAEGLFDMTRKRPIPALPRTVGVVTSWNGAAIQDFMRVLERRFKRMHVRVIPSLVQGTDAPGKLIKAIEYFNQTRSCDVIVLTRGGGSAEDLWAFNDEQLARAIAASEIPVVSAVGHERDHSISDFVADYAAATPTAAAEFIVKGKAELADRLDTLEKRLLGWMQLGMERYRGRLRRVSACAFLNHPEDWFHALAQRLDYAEGRLEKSLPAMVDSRRQRLSYLEARLNGVLPNLVQRARLQLGHLEERLPQAMASSLQKAEHRLERTALALSALNPRGVLSRGYSILLDGEGHAVRRASDASAGARLKALLGEGELNVSVINE